MATPDVTLGINFGRIPSILDQIINETEEEDEANPDKQLSIAAFSSLGTAHRSIPTNDEITEY
jgi:hypothetical protein